MESVFLVRNVAADKYGGGETYQLLLAKMLDRNGFRPYIITASKGLIRAARKNKIDVIESPYINRQNWSGWRNILFPIYVVQILRLRGWYKKIFKEHNPKVVNIQSRDDWIAATGIAKKMGIKVLWTDHMDLRSWVLTNVNIWYKNLIGKWVLSSAKRADKIIMISDYERKCVDLISRKRIKNIVTIKNGVVDEHDRYKSVKAKSNSICYIGRIVEYKGIGELIESLDLVLEKFGEVKLNIYGSGEESVKFEQLAKKVGGSIIFHGQTNEPLRALAENEIFVLPSYREGLSLSLLDAAMMKKKIVASDVDGNPEIITNKITGLLVPSKSVKALAKALIYMLENNDEAEKMARNARKLYEEKYNFEKIFNDKMLPLYNLEKE